MARYRSATNRRWRDAITRARRSNYSLGSSRHRYPRCIHSGQKVMTAILAIIDRLLLLVVKWAVAREQAKAQRLRDAIEQNPANWFADHFDSVSDDATAKKTNEADPSDTKTS